MDNISNYSQLCLGQIRKIRKSQIIPRVERSIQALFS